MSARYVRTLALASCVATAACDFESSDDQDTEAAFYDYQGPLSQEAIEARLAERGEVRLGEDGTLEGFLPEGVVLAFLETPDGRKVTFTWSSVTNDIEYSEVAAEGSLELFTPDVGILERYIALTTLNSPVPLPLLELDNTIEAREREELVGGRSIGFVVDATATSKLPVVDDDSVVAAATASCQSGTWFRDHHCWFANNGTIPPNFTSPIHACDSGAWTSLNRSTGNPARKNTHSTAVACGTDVSVTYKHKAFGTWWGLADPQTIPDDNVHWQTRLSDAFWRRRIEYRRKGGSGFLRAESMFGN